jgi:selenocysteine lyase/cysteine desulfurase
MAGTGSSSRDAWRGRLWFRVSAQVYNDRSDIERLADAVLHKLG